MVEATQNPGLPLVCWYRSSPGLVRGTGLIAQLEVVFAGGHFRPYQRTTELRHNQVGHRPARLARTADPLTNVAIAHARRRHGDPPCWKLASFARTPWRLCINAFRAGPPREGGRTANTVHGPAARLSRSLGGNMCP
jgi:hypothetical protein